MMAAIFEIVDAEPGQAVAPPPVSDVELVSDNQLNADRHHQLIELCW
jgi:hypothetical protein